MYLPSVECTWASVMRNQQKVCSFHREHAMAPGVDGWRQVCVVTKRLWLKKSTPTGLRDAHHWSSHLRSRQKREALSLGLKFIPCLSSVPRVISQRNSPLSHFSFFFLSQNTWCCTCIHSTADMWQTLSCEMLQTHASHWNKLRRSIILRGEIP